MRVFSQMFLNFKITVVKKEVKLKKLSNLGIFFNPHVLFKIKYLFSSYRKHQNCK